MLRATGHQSARPEGIIIEPTNHCTNSCPICGSVQNSCRRSKGYMAWDLFTRIAEQTVAIRPALVFLYAQGESLMHRRIVDMVKELSKNDLDTEIVTNGDLLTPHLVTSLYEAGLTNLTVSHPAATPENFARCRGKTYRSEDEKRLFEALGYWEGQNRDLTIRSLVVPDLLYHHLDSLADFLERCFAVPAVNRVDLHGYLPWPRHFCIDLMPTIFERPWRCELGLQNLTVFWDGTVTPCSYDVNAELAIGHVDKTPLFELYNDKKMRMLRKRWHGDGRNWPELCKACMISRCKSPTVPVLKKKTKHRALFNPEEMISIFEGRGGVAG